MINVTEYYWDYSQLMIFNNNNLTSFNATDEPPVLIFNNTNLINFYSNCCLTTPTVTAVTEPNFTQYLQEMPSDRVSLLIFLFLFSFATVFGNSLVILAVIRERYLHTSTNYFVTSLAVADCLVGLVVMPFSALYEVLQNTWFFGTDWCDTWRSLDVLFSTASILNLCVISLDRYWAITDPFSYPMKMTRNRAVVLIAAVWFCSSLISFPAIVFWRAVRHGTMPMYKCTFTEHLGYLVFSSTISFYLPLLVMVFTYCRIYRAAAEQTRSLKLGTKQVLMTSGEMQLTLRIHRGGTTREGHQHNTTHNTTQNTANSTPEEPDEEPLSALHNNGIRHRHLGKNFSLSRKLAKFAKEKKAAKTLGIVMGVFIVCWLPFFVVNLLTGLCEDCIAHEEVVSAVVTWLGWINSSMNPVIYACWSRDFRRAFVRILCVCCPRKVRRKYQPTMRSKASQQTVPNNQLGNQKRLCSECHLANMVTSTTSRCSVCDGTQQRTSRLRTCTNCSKLKLRHSVHHNCYHHRRSRAIKVIKRCTFATATTEIPNSNELIGEENPHMSFKSQSSNSSNASSVRIIE